MKPNQLVEKEIGKNYFLVPDETPMEINVNFITKTESFD